MILLFSCISTVLPPININFIKHVSNAQLAISSWLYIMNWLRKGINNIEVSFAFKYMRMSTSQSNSATHRWDVFFYLRPTAELRFSLSALSILPSSRFS